MKRLRGNENEDDDYNEKEVDGDEFGEKKDNTREGQEEQGNKRAPEDLIIDQLLTPVSYPNIGWTSKFLQISVFQILGNKIKTAVVIYYTKSIL